MRKLKPTTKRKIAGVVAILLIVAMVLSTFLPLLLRTAYAEEPQQFTVEAQVGLGGAVKMGHPAPVEIKVTNNSGKDFKGRVSLKAQRYSYEVDGNKNAEYFADIELAAGETKQIQGRIGVKLITNKAEVTITDNKNKQVFKKLFDVVTDREDTLWVGVLSDSTRTYDMIAANFGEYSQNYNITRLVELKPENIKYVQSTDMLVINDFDFDALSDSDILLLKRRLDDGGLLIVGADDYENKQWFKTLTGDAREGTIQENTSAYDTWNNTAYSAYDYAKDTIDMSAIDAQGQNILRSAINFLSDEELMKLVSLIYYYEDKYGSAQNIADIALNDSTAPSFNELRANIMAMYEEAKNYDADFKNFDFVSQYGYEYDPPADAYSNMQDKTVYYSGAGELMVLPPDTVASAPVTPYFSLSSASIDSGRMNDFDLEKPAEILGSLFLAAIMLYAIFIGPFLYLILKKKDKREKAVKYIPLSALALTAIIIVCSMGSKFQRPLAEVVNLVPSGGTGLLKTEGIMVVSTPSKGKMTITSDKITSSLPLSGYRWDSSYATEDYKASLTDFNYTFEDQMKWATKKFEFEGDIEMNGSLTAKLINYDSSAKTAEIEVTNNTGYDLEDVCASGRGSDYYDQRIIKKLKNGETKTCTVYLSNTVWRRNSFSIKGSESGGYESISSNKRQSLDMLAINDTMLVTGFVKSDTAGVIKVNGRRASKNEVTAIYTYIRPENTGFADGIFGDDVFAREVN